MHKYSKGVTLVELMVVVVIVAILGAIAIPSYRNYVMRTNRTEATSALLRIQTQQEKAFLQFNQYATQLTGAGPVGLNMTATSEFEKYNLDIVTPRPGGGAGSYLARAIPAAGKGQQDDEPCQLITITESGTRGAADSGGTNQTQTCWR
jgi:type IV pilus assembly protein PilE